MSDVRFGMDGWRPCSNVKVLIKFIEPISFPLEPGTTYNKYCSTNHQEPCNLTKGKTKYYVENMFLNYCPYMCKN